MKVKDEKLIAAKREQIIKIAENIIQNEGIEKLSIRKIACEMNQTPGILYHYFKNKDEILMEITQQGYKEILQTIQQYTNIDDPVQRIHKTLHAYINAMVKKGRLFIIMMQSSNVEVQRIVNVLSCEIHQRKSVNALCQSIQYGVDKGIFQCDHIEIRTKVIWASVYGLIERIIMEDIDQTLKESLINEQIKMILNSLKGEQ